MERTATRCEESDDAALSLAVLSSLGLATGFSPRTAAGARARARERERPPTPRLTDRIYIYIYTKREREREREKPLREVTGFSSIFFLYVERETHRARAREREREREKRDKGFYCVCLLNALTSLLQEPEIWSVALESTVCMRPYATSVCGAA
jgi:hypothetical protein